MTDSKNPEKQASEKLGDAPFVGDFRIRASLVRSALSSEQTLMAWMRTSLSLFTLGFAIAQFFHYLQRSQPDSNLDAGPRRLGIALVGVGVAVILLAIDEHLRRLRMLKKLGLPTDVGLTLPLATAAVLLFIGVAAFVIVLLNWHL